MARPYSGDLRVRVAESVLGGRSVCARRRRCLASVRPSLATNGDLVGATSFAYNGCSNGHLTTLGKVLAPPLLPITYFAFLIGKNTTLYGTSNVGPQSQPCTAIPGGYPAQGCGYIFSYQLQ